MSSDTYVVDNQMSLGRLLKWLATLDYRKAWRITVERLEPKAGVDQEAVLRGKEAKIAEFTGDTPAFVHDWLLYLNWGGQIYFPRPGVYFVVPDRRTRTGENPLRRSEMTRHIQFVEAFAAMECGLQV